MKQYGKFIFLIATIFVALFLGINIYLNFLFENSEARNYLVEINRLEATIKEEGQAKIRLSEDSQIKKITPLGGDSRQAFFRGEDYDYVVREINGELYRFDYEISIVAEQNQMRWVANGITLVSMVVILILLFFIDKKLIRPFHRVRELPYELSKGNLVVGLKEEKGRYFGKFIWGLDLLREKLESQRQKELNLQKEKKTLILSLSHDIKTPLSAIKLYANALSRNLYQEEEKKKSVAESINEKADEIEKYVEQISHATSEDFLNLEVEEGEFYLKDVIDEIEDYYSDKLGLLKTEFEMGTYSNCLLRGDKDRVIEVIQNVIENAVKYGDGNGIYISFSEEESCKLLTIENTGCTLKDDEVPHIFESFWRGSNVGSKQGNGLGLYICRTLMRKMGGEIFAKRKNNTMCVTLVLQRVHS